MVNEISQPEKIQRLAVAYQKLNDEGREILDNILQEFKEIGNEPEKIADLKRSAMGNLSEIR